MRICHFCNQNGSFVLNKIFLVQTIIITFIYLLALGIVQNSKKILATDPELWECIFFGPKMVHLPQIFLGKNYYHFHLPIGPFDCRIFKKFLQRIKSYDDPPFLVPKWPICPNENFFKKHVNTPCSFHSCLSKCQKWK